VTLTYDLPTAWEAVTILPSARIPPVVWTVDGEELPSNRPQTVRLGPSD
jgi:hypothetical protein